MTDLKVEEWLQSYTSLRTKRNYGRYFKLFEQFQGKSGTEMLSEARRFTADPDKANIYPLKIMEFHAYLLKLKAQRTGSVRGRCGGTTGTFKDKTLSQLTAKLAVAAVQSFFSFHNLPLNLRRFKRQNKVLQHAKPEKKKHELTGIEIQKLFDLANLRDKCVLGLGLMGQDESTIAGLRTADFEGKLNGSSLEFIESVRPKTNAEVCIVLTVEVQNLLRTYLTTVKSGWLFQGYKNSHIENTLPDKIFKSLCEKAKIVDNGRRLSFHCCRLWFSAQLRNRVSDDIIDKLTAHELRFGGAYVPSTLAKLRELLTEADLPELLKLQLMEQGDTQKQEIDVLKSQIGDMQKRMDAMIQNLMVNTTIVREKDGVIYETDFGEMSERKNPVIKDRRSYRKTDKKP